MPHRCFVLCAVMALLCVPAADAALTLEAEINPDPVRPSRMFDVQISVSSTAASGSLTLRVLWPQNVQGFTTITGGGSCPGSCSAGEFLVWNLPPLGPGASLTVGFDDFASSFAADGTMIPFQIELLDGGVTAATKTVITEVQEDAPLELRIDPLSDPVAPGDVLTYEVVYANSGASSAEDAELELPLPAGVQFLSATGGGTLVGSTVSWDLGSLAANDGARQRVNVQVDAVAGGTLLAVESATLSATINFLPHEIRATAVSRVDVEPLELAAEINPDPVIPDRLIEAQISVRNPTAAVTGSLTLRVLWPERIQGFTTATGGGDCPGSCSAGEFLFWTLGPLGPGASLTVSFDDFASSFAPSGTLIPFEIELLEGGQPTRNFSHTVRVQEDAPLKLSLGPLADPVAPGEALVYELVWGNTSTQAADNVELKLPLPVGTDFLSATGSGVLSGDTVIWDLGSVAAGDGSRARVSVEVDAGTDHLLMIDSATISGDFAFQNRESRAMAVSRVDTEPLELVAEINPGPFAPDRLFDAQISISNPTDSVTGSLTLRVLWPERIQGFTTATSGGDCPGSCSAGEYLFWTLGPLGPGADVTVSFDDFVSSFAPGGTLIPFEIELLEGALPARNLSYTARVQQDPPLEIALDPESDPVGAGNVMIYRVTYGNVGSQAANNAELRVPLPAGTQFLGVSGGGVLDGDTVIWDLGSLPPGGGGRQRLGVAVDDAPDNLLVIDSATISGDFAFQSRQARAMAVTRVDTEPLRLSVDIGSGVVAPDGLVDAQIRVENLAASTTGSLTLRVLWPEHIQGFTTTTGGGDCPGSCSAGEYLFWTLGTLGPGASLMVDFNDFVSSFAANGTLIPFEIELLEGGFPARNFSSTLLVNPFTDNDMDGVPDILDDDDDDDGMPDWWEILHGLNPLDPSDAGEDPDMDGFNNLEEFERGSNPNIPGGLPSECVPDANTLCIDDQPGDRRFKVTVDFETSQGGGRMGEAKANPLDAIGIPKGGIFAFGDSANPEILIKVLNGCGSANPHYWIFFAATTNFGFDVAVEDTKVGWLKTYSNPDLMPAATVTDTRALPTCAFAATAGSRREPAQEAADFARQTELLRSDPIESGVRGSCTPDANTLCLDNEPGDRRFKITVSFETSQGGGRMGDALANPLDAIGIPKGGIFAFSDPRNPEILVKVLNGCGSSIPYYWVFFAATTNFGFDLTVEDTVADVARTYTNPDLNPAATVTDTRALDTCP